ncbi:uromodulin-like 1 [Entelurus aequoreus]|uniref:uromodulin-like 1 n=1 Tax=Entelurus aequoreus TaxID=161455 RepID=UPI002B1D468D|nr:uromodulin-like 1 [Entelurus aequoreus]
MMRKMRWMLIVWTLLALLALCTGQQDAGKGLSPSGYHLCLYNQTLTVSSLVLREIPYVTTKPCGGWLSWTTCPVKLYRIVQLTEYRAVTASVTRCCHGYMQVGSYCALPLKRTEEFTSKPGSCPAANGSHSSGGDCDWDIDCPGWQKCCHFLCSGTSNMTSYTENGGCRFNATVTVKTDYQQLNSEDGALLNHTRLLQAMVTGALQSNVSVHYLASWPVQPFRTATSLLIGCTCDLSLHNVSTALHVLLIHIQEVSAVTVQDVNECAHPALHRCSPQAQCNNTVGSYQCVCHTGYVDVDPSNPGTLCTALPGINNLQSSNITGTSFFVYWSSLTLTPQTYLVVLSEGSEVIEWTTKQTMMEIKDLQPGINYNVTVQIHSNQSQGDVLNMALRTDAHTLEATTRLTNIQFTEDLRNASSQAYKNLTAGIMEEIYRSLTPEMKAMVNSGQVRIEIRNFSPGSVVVNITLIFSPSPKQDITNTSTDLLYALINSSIYIVDENDTNIIDFDECVPGENDCSQWAMCKNTWGSYSCSCLDGFMDTNPQRSGRACQDSLETLPTSTFVSIVSMSSQTTTSTPPAPTIDTIVEASTAITASVIIPPTTSSALPAMNNAQASTTNIPTTAIIAPATTNVPTTTSIGSTTTLTEPTTTSIEPTTTYFVAMITAVTYVATTISNATAFTSAVLTTTSIAPRTTTSAPPPPLPVAMTSSTAPTTTSHSLATTFVSSTTTSVPLTTTAPATTTIEPNTTSVLPTITTASTTTIEPTTIQVPATTTTAPSTTTIKLTRTGMSTTSTTVPTTSTMEPTTTSVPTTTTTAQTTTTIEPPTTSVPMTTTTAPTATTIEPPTPSVPMTTTTAPTATTIEPPTTSVPMTTTTAPTTTSIEPPTTSVPMTTTTAPTTTTIEPPTTSVPMTTTTAPTTTTIEPTTNGVATTTLHSYIMNSALGDISVDCKVTGIMVTVAKEFLVNNNIRESTLYLGQQECGITGGNVSHAQLTVEWNDTMCLKSFAKNDTNYVASVTLFNTVETNSTPNGTLEAPLLHLEVPVICTYMRNMLMSTDFGSMGYNLMKDVITGLGFFQVSVQLMNGTVSLPYNYSLSPEEAVVVKVSMNTSADELKVVISSCWATPTPNPADNKRFYFLDNRCALNTYTNVLMNGNSSTSRVSVKIFSFVNVNLIYLHCHVQICIHIGSDTCVPDCVQRTAWSSNTIGRGFGSTGPLLKSEEEPLEDVNDQIQLITLSCLGVAVTLFLIVGFACLFNYHRNRVGHYNFAVKPKPQNFTFIDIKA